MPHPNYQRLSDLARRCHEAGRALAGIGEQDIALARLYSYAFRLHVIGAFHATRVALQDLPAKTPQAVIHRDRAVELLETLADRGMDPIAADARVLLSSFYGYHRDVERVAAALADELTAGGDQPGLRKIRERFLAIMDGIRNSNGICLTRDTEAPDQASFVVPNLGITIVPLVYGDFHSWNLAWLAGQNSDVPRHRHGEGVEIHLGYSPIQGQTILGDCSALVREGYAMPIPPMTAHGFINEAAAPHHVPFIFGSLKGGGWGVFFDVEPQPFERSRLQAVDLASPAMNGSVHLERAIAEAAAASCLYRKTLIPGAATNLDGSGGLELSISRVTANELSIPPAGYRILSVVRGAGVVKIAGQKQAIDEHDHFGIPAGLVADVRATGEAPLVLLDVILV